MATNQSTGNYRQQLMGRFDTTCPSQRLTVISAVLAVLALQFFVFQCCKIRVLHAGSADAADLLSTPDKAMHHNIGARDLDIRVFVGVLSRADNQEARDVIRETWGSDPRLARVMFFTLRPRSLAMFRHVREEAAAFGDIVVVSEVLEHYHNITYATLSIMKTAAVLGKQVTHVFKTDDDCYLRVALLLAELSRLPKQWLFAGFPSWRGVIARNPEYKAFVPLSNWARNDTTFYGQGLGYAITADLVQHIAAGAAHMVMPPDNLLRVEDRAVGYWVHYVAAERNASLSYGGYPWDGKPHVCKNHTVVTHFIGGKQVWHPDLIRCMHRNGGHCCSLPTLQQLQSRGVAQSWQ